MDLVLYHRVLKCHVLVELKAGDFAHEHLGQLNTYVSYYRATQMTEGDQPPVGILLCTGKDHALVEYALAGMNNALFVSRYQVGLPNRDEMAALVRRAVREVEAGGAPRAGAKSTLGFLFVALAPETGAQVSAGRVLPCYGTADTGATVWGRVCDAGIAGRAHQPGLELEAKWTH